ncbi:MAG: UDP-N-acetylmuramoyl-tripeptide--D-alanyl-D-alanine ligase [Betaproteobacteria bacterium]
MSGFSMSALQMVKHLGARFGGEDVMLTGISTDTRTLVRGDLYVAIKGDSFDGHDYLDKARENGAAAALVAREIAGAPLPQIIVDDSQDARIAFGRIAKLWRSQFNVPTIALTGSNGKTTVKEMLRCILAVHTGNADDVLATEGNLNNDIGVPMMMIRQRPQHRYAVFEMGMNHLGEIDYLTHLIEPDVAMVVMAGTAHIGELGSREAIAQAKGEIYGALKPAGIAVVNMHDRFGNFWRENLRGHRMLGFGIAAEDDVAGTFGEDSLGIKFKGQHIAVRLHVPGEHNQRNALAAAAAACALDVPLETIRRGLEKFSGVDGRLRTFTGHNSATIIDDTYNANPDSVKAAIRVLAARQTPRVLVLGDMGELGANAPAMHREVGEFARKSGVEKMFVLGELSREAAKAFGAQAKHFASADDLASSLQPLLTPQTTVLVKGSRFMKMERVVEKLVPTYSLGGGHH